MRKPLLVLSCFIAFYASAQLNAEQALNKLNKSFPQEKIYLMFNKEAFVAGETIHFRSYVFSGYQLSALSTNLYVELYNTSRKLIDKRLIPLGEGIGEGSFVLPAGLPENVYYIRAYTKWMLNFDPSFQYFKSIPIYNPESPERLSLKSSQWNAAAYPESGNLVAGIVNKVAVRLLGNIAGISSWKASVIESNSNNTILQFNSYNNEVGSFDFIPKENARYEVLITDNLGNSKKILLPPAQNNGAILKVRQEQNRLVCQIFIKGKPNNTKYKLIAHMQHQLIYSGKVGSSDSSAMAVIPLDSLENGIIHLSLFNEKEQVVAERLAFVKAQPLSLPALQYDTLSLDKRGYNHWVLKTDSADKYNYTVLVTDPSLDPKENILSRLWLTSDLGDDIAEPAWYVDPQNQNRQQALDALLITERWNRFSWSQVLRNNFPRIVHMPDRYLSYIGTVFVGRRMQLNKEVNLFIQYNDSTYELRQATTDSSGAFYLNDLIFTDSVKVYYQLNSKKAAPPLTKAFFEDDNRFEKYEFGFPATAYTLVTRNEKDSLPGYVQTSLNSLDIDRMIEKRERKLETVFVRTKQRRKTDELNNKLSSPGFRSFDETVFDFVNEDPPYGNQNILSWLSARVAGLQNTFAGLFSRGLPVNVYVDEMLVDGSFASGIPLQDIAMVKFIRNGGGIVQVPAVLIYTRRGETKFPFYGLPNIILRGYQRPEPFNEVNYKDPFFRSVINDQRPVLLWNTFTAVKPDMPSGIRFYHNDKGGPVRVIVTGVNSKGMPVYEERIISSN